MVFLIRLGSLRDINPTCKGPKPGKQKNWPADTDWKMTLGMPASHFSGRAIEENLVVSVLDILCSKRDLD